MNIIVDTSIWSLALRRTKVKLAPNDENLVKHFRKLTEQGRVVLIGAVRQEILSGIKHASQFLKLKSLLRHFPDLPLESEHYELAAHCFNNCRARGIQGSNTDFLICSAALAFSVEIFTADRDFECYQKVLPIRLLKA